MMRIVDRPTFLAMPDGTVYAKYEPCNFGELSVKGVTCFSAEGVASDWACQSVTSPWFPAANDSGDWFQTLDRIEAGEPSPPLDYDFFGRDGLFDQDQLFAVWEQVDVAAVVRFLTRGQPSSQGDET